MDAKLGRRLLRVQLRLTFLVIPETDPLHPKAPGELAEHADLILDKDVPYHKAAALLAAATLLDMLGKETIAFRAAVTRMFHLGGR